MYAVGTKVPVSQSRAEIERLLGKHKCSQFISGTDYDAGLARVQFKAQGRFVRFVMALPDRKKYSFGKAGAQKWEQSERQRWRALGLVIKAKLESVENGIATFEEEFLAQIVMPNDKTVAEMIIPQIAAAYQSGVMPKALTENSEVING